MRDWVKGLGRLRSSLEGNRTLRPVAERLRMPSIWHVSRRSVARGVAVGLFSAFVLPVGQVFLAALFAILVRGNLIVASLATLVTNPFVMPAIYVAAWRTGREILGPTAEIRGVLEDEPMTADFLTGLSDASLYTAVGLLVFSTVSSVVGYVLVHLLWWVSTRGKIRQRKRRAVERRASRGEV